jgi:hypothetical protein
MMCYPGSINAASGYLVEYFCVIFSVLNANSITSVSIKVKEPINPHPHLRKHIYSDNPTTQAIIEDKSMKLAAENRSNRRRAKGTKCAVFPPGRSKVGRHVYNA